jgi:hypothetical protein
MLDRADLKVLKERLDPEVEAKEASEKQEVPQEVDSESREVPLEVDSEEKEVI